jgi:Na+-transporting NADH:ubiquinone oxidoreductase subunit D
MSTATAPAPAPQAKEARFSRQNRKLLSDPFNEANPVTVQVLGICSALAITAQLKTALVMAVSVTVVMGVSSAVISAMRRTIPARIRMIVELLVVSCLVVLVDQVLKAFAYDVSRQLSVYVGLIITNCIIMGRLEAFAMGHGPWKATLDGIGNGAGYGTVLVVVAVVREALGSGTLLGYRVVPQFLYAAGYENNGLMLTSAAAMFVIGLLIWAQRAWDRKLIDIS